MLSFQEVRIFGHNAIEAAKAVETTRPAAGNAPARAKALAALPNRFVAFYFDDTFMSFEDVARTRAAVAGRVQGSFGLIR